MKKVAGRLKLELSQYRDLEAFAQFGSDLDPETQRTLARGERLVKTLNQGERQPMPVEEQVAAIYAATNGYLDRIDADRVEEFHEGLRRARALLRVGRAGEDRATATGATRRRRRSTRSSRSSPRTSATTSTRRASRSPRTPRTPPRRARATRSRRRATATTRPATATADGELDASAGEGGRGGLAPTALSAWPRRKSSSGSPPSRTSRRSRGRWRWSPPPACAAPSSASRRCGPYASAIRRMTRQAAEAAQNVPNIPILKDREDAKHGRHRDHDRRPRPGRRVQLAGHARRHPRGRRARARGPRGRLLRVRPPRRVLADLPRPRGQGPVHRAHRPPGLRQRARDRRRRRRRPTSTRSSTASRSSTTATISPLTQQVTREVLLPLQQATVAEAEEMQEDLAGERHEDTGHTALTEYEPEPGEILAAARARLRRDLDLPRAAGVHGVRARRAHDRHAQRLRERRRSSSTT